MKWERDVDPRWEPSYPGQEVPVRYRRRRGLLDALKAGKDVILSRRSAEARHDFRFRLPWDRSVRSVRVSPDDVVRPTNEEHPWYGCATEDTAGQR
jgi:hypothetical protein